MAKIVISEPDSVYTAEIDTGAMNVELKEVFLGVTFVTEGGQRLTVSQRDHGFDVELTRRPNTNDPGISKMVFVS